MSKNERYFTISEIAKEFDVKKSHIRFCEEKGLIKPRVSKLNRRLYGSYDHARLKLIFHCVVVGYSQEQIVELIGLPDSSLDPYAQVRQGIEDAQKKINELEHRRNEAKFHERTSIMTELNMMWEYIKEIKSIQLEDVEKPPAEPAVDVKVKEKTVSEPPKTKTTDVEKELERPTGRMIPVFAGGFALLLIIGGYFFYQSVQKKTAPLKLAQKERTQTETHPIYQQPVPQDQTVEPTPASPAPKETLDQPSSAGQEQSTGDSSPAVEVASVTDETSSPLEKQKGSGTQAESVPEAGKKETAALEKQEIKEAADTQPEDTENRKTSGLDVGDKKPPEPESALTAASMADNISSVPEKETADRARIQKGPRDKTGVETVEEKLAVKEELPAPSEKTPEPAIKERVESETSAPVAAVTGDPSRVLEKQNIAAPEDKQASEAEAPADATATKPVVESAPPPEAAEELAAAAPETKNKETVDSEKPSVETVPAESGSDTPTATAEAEEARVPEADGQATEVAAGIAASSAEGPETAATPSVELSSVSEETSTAPETETPSSDTVEEIPAQPDAEKSLVASKAEGIEKEDVSDRLKTFLNTYCQTYENKNLDKFFTFFTPDASENNRPFHELIPTYRKNMEMIDSFKYRIEVIAYSTQPDTGNVRVQGKFFITQIISKW